MSNIFVKIFTKIDITLFGWKKSKRPRSYTALDYFSKVYYHECYSIYIYLLNRLIYQGGSDHDFSVNHNSKYNKQSNRCFDFK
jgi:hypothetical protein